MANSVLEDYIKDVPVSEEKANPSVDDDVETKRESLKILAAMGTTKEYLGVNLSLGDIIKLSDKDVERKFTLYQAVSAKELTGGLVKSGIQAAIYAISCVVSLDDPDQLCKDLQNDMLVKRELSDIAGLLVMKGGRSVALASAFFQVARHVKFGLTQEIAIDAQQPSSITEQPVEQPVEQPEQPVKQA